MRSRSPHSSPTVFSLVLLSACMNPPDATGDPTSGLAGAPAPAGPAAPLAPAPTAPAPAAPAMLAGVTRPGASPENSAEFRELIAADWELPPGIERYICARLTLTETMFVGNWSSEAPFGTHHTLLTMSAQPDGQPDGVSECDAATLGTQTAYVSGIRTADYKLPSGVAMKLTQGSQVILNLHVFNPTDKPLRGHSGARIQMMAEKDVRDVADFLGVSAVKLDVPSGRSTSHVKCTLDRDATVFGVGPHMHQTGVALQAVAHTAVQGDVMLFDGPYSFEDQQMSPIGPLQFKAGDTVDVACTYENPSDKTLHFGGSSNDEMCALMLMRYPAGGPFFCAK